MGLFALLGWRAGLRDLLQKAGLRPEQGIPCDPWHRQSDPSGDIRTYDHELTGSGDQVRKLVARRVLFS